MIAYITALSEVISDFNKSLKETISTKPVMRFPDLDLPFEVQTDASDRALGGLLVQEGHFMAFESRKLNNA